MIDPRNLTETTVFMIPGTMTESSKQMDSDELMKQTACI